MNVSELYDLTSWISEEIEGAQVLQKYQMLQAIIQQNLQPNQTSKPFENEKEDLITALRGVPLGRLTRDQVDFLEQLRIADTVGEFGIAELEDILYKNVIDMATSVQKLNEIISILNSGIAKSNQIKAGLSGCLVEEEYESKDEVLIRVNFSGDAAISNVKDFKAWANVWYEIGRGVAMAHDSAPEDIKVVGATKGSIIIELAVVASVATTVSGIILAALKVAEKILDIRKKAEELKALNLSNKKLAKDLEAEADKEKLNGIREITINISKKLNIDTAKKGDVVNSLDVSVKNLVDFVEKGGVVDFVAPDDDVGEDSEQYVDLNLNFQEIRRLERRLELLEYGGPDRRD